MRGLGRGFAAPEKYSGTGVLAEDARPPAFGGADPRGGAAAVVVLGAREIRKNVGQGDDAGDSARGVDADDPLRAPARRGEEGQRVVQRGGAVTREQWDHHARLRRRGVTRGRGVGERGGGQ